MPEIKQATLSVGFQDFFNIENGDIKYCVILSADPEFTTLQCSFKHMLIVTVKLMVERAINYPINIIQL